MELAVRAASWVVGKALGPVTDSLLEAWAASVGLGPNMDALKMELLYAQGMLDNAQDREIRSPALKELLHKLRQLAYSADDVLDELEYFRIQDALDGTYHAAGDHAGGCVKSLVLNASQTARAVVAKLKPSCGGGSRDTVVIRSEHDEQDNSNGKKGCFPSICSCGGQSVSSSPPSPTNQDDDDVNNGDGSNTAGNGRRFSCGASLSEVQGCLSGAFLCGTGKRELSSSPLSSPAKSIGKCFPCFSFQSVDGNAHTGMSEDPNMLLNKRFLCGAWRRSSKVQRRKNTASQAPKLKFNRVEISAKMRDITEHLKPVCAKVSNILNLEFMGTHRITKQDIAKKRPMTTSDITENQLYGRDIQKKKIVDGITHDEYFANELVVLPIVGPGGIGKTTFIQHVYEEVKRHFDVHIWICVSLNFNASRLAQEAVKQIPRVDGGNENGTDQELIERRLKGKRFLLVLDDMWACHEDEWKKLLAPFGKGGEKGNMVIVTTRIPEVAKMVIKIADCSIEMERLEGEDFMRFFEACIFSGQKPWEGHTELYDVGEKIVSKLKGFPLAAKTVGRLLKSQLTLEHWTTVLESKEWELQTNENDIMPALKLSYDYLPFHLQQCFYYCALFPEDYEFERKELVHFWIGLDIVHPCDLNRRLEDVGLGYLNDLVNHGFFKMNERNGGRPYYIIHDLLHDLAVKISSFECLSIHSSNVKSIQIPQDVRHLSVIVDNKDVEDIKTFKYYRNDLSALDKRLKVENLRTLMVFGQHHVSFVKTFCVLFEKARALRAIYLSGASYNVEDMLHNFSKLIHLRYLKIKSSYKENTKLLSALSRFYHLEVIDIQELECGSGFTRHMSNLAKLRHFLVPEDELQLHSNIVEVGKLKLLQELRSFEVGKESEGFEISQLGQLSELGGSLAIRNLERICTMEEASEARLIQIKRLRKLTLEWDANVHKKDTSHEENALEILIPYSNLQDLCIRGHGGSKCPQWLGENLSVRNLESLCLDGVAWNIFPPIGELLLVNELHEEISSDMYGIKFQNLRRLELVKLPRLKKWVVDAPCQLFVHLEVLKIEHCSKLMELSFSHSTCCQQEIEKEGNVNWFPSLRELKIKGCPELLSIPPVPWSSTLCSAKIRGVGSSFEKLVCEEKLTGEYRLNIEETVASDSTFWNVLAFGNLTELKELTMDRCPPLPMHHFQLLSSLKTLILWNSSTIVFPFVEGESRGKHQYQFPAEVITIHKWGASAKELTRLLICFPKLSELKVRSCEKITGLGVAEEEDKVDDEQIEQHQQQDSTTGMEEITAEGLLLLPSQLRKLRIDGCSELSLRSNPVDYSKEAGRTSGGQDSSHYFPFPTSLEELYLEGVEGMDTLLPLSNLTSLTYLEVGGCENLRGEGLRPLLAQGRLTKLIVHESPNFFTGSEPSLPRGQESPSSNSKLQELWTDDIAGVLAAPIWTLLSSSLTELYLAEDKEVEGFTEEQEEALQLLASVETIDFWDCDKLRRLPAVLHRLPNLKGLFICGCEDIQSLPKNGLPSSLKELHIDGCSDIRCLPKECLPSSLEELHIEYCPAIRSLPKVEDLPSSLRVLDVRDSKSEELRRRCRKLIGTIPIVKA